MKSQLLQSNQSNASSAAQHAAGTQSLRRQSAPVFIQRKCKDCEEKIKLKPATSFSQKKSAEGHQATQAVSNRIEATKGKGNQLPKQTRSFMEQRMNADFSNVRIHKDADAAQMSDDLSAHAFTVGNDIYFNEGKYAPESSAGKQLLAHELTHVVQQLPTNLPVVQRQSTQNPPQQTNPQLPQPIVDLLQRTSDGQAAINNFTTYNVTLILTKSGRPAFYDANSNTCTVNDALPVGIVASYFIHEMFHVQQEKTGKSGDAKKMDKSTFVNTMVNEEITGTIKGYQAYMELEQADKIPKDSPRPPRYNSFKSAYDYGREKAKEANPKASEADLKKAGLENAGNAVRWYVKEGGLAPFQGLKYSQYYGAEWEKAQKSNSNN
ncbi:MAG: DUF4157 domain-containing protein [Chitinophagaceae bacterium]|jgi:hypothetical protein|nr:DUF4157 domain-containing protein [Chitinophagaceae bacterium]